MNSSQQEKDEIREIELLIGRILRVGVGIATLFLLIGLVLLVITGNSGYQDNQFPRSLSVIFSGIMAGKSGAFLLLGVLMLIFTPILRVIASIFSFAKEKDFLYVVITSIVLLILAVALLFSLFY